MKIYAIPGMGADARIFHKLKLPNEFECVTIDWVVPKNDDTLESYSLRLLSVIDTSEPFGLIGLSMGGMIACSFAHHYPPEFIILISSVPTYQDIPPYYFWLGKLGFTKIIPMNSLKYLSKLKRKIFKESTEDKELLLNMIQSSDPAFLRWSIQSILKWKQPAPSVNIYHIHGKHDWLLPPRLLKNAPILINGGHAMILSSSLELQDKINMIFNDEIKLMNKK